MDQNEVQILALKWMDGTISPREKNILNQWYQSEYEETINWESDQSREDLRKRLFLSILNRINEPEKAGPKLIPIRRNWYRISVAAAIILAIALGGYLIYNQQPEKETPPLANTKDIPPGGDKAILTLADGSQIILNDASNGAIANQGNVKVIKLDGQISYQLSANSQQPVVYNTITTPRTGQYQLILADGTMVWLDAESSIRFPNRFTGTDRRVELKGQGYFEVAHNPKMPFHVTTGIMDVQVLGTHFNVMAYANEEAIKTTLLEGSVKVTAGTETALLKPGAQAILTSNLKLQTSNSVNLDQAVAWKNGMFQLEGTSIREVFRQIERWYDVDVIVEGSFNDENLSGVFSRKQYVSQLLKILEEAGVGHFRMEGKKIYVTN
jgi:transmembrane sensor